MHTDVLDTLYYSSYFGKSSVFHIKSVFKNSAKNFDGVILGMKRIRLAVKEMIGFTLPKIVDFILMIVSPTISLVSNRNSYSSSTRSRFMKMFTL